MINKFKILSVIIFIITVFAGCNSSAYKKAEALFNEESYAEAATAFLALGDYKDSADRADEANRENDYQRASNLLSSGQYTAAREIFETLSGFRDAEAQAELCGKFIIYNGAVIAMGTSTGNTTDRIRLFIDACNGFNAVRGFENADGYLADSLSLLLSELLKLDEFATQGASARNIFSELFFEGAEAAGLIFSDQTVSIHNDLRSRAEELSAAVGLWTVYRDILNIQQSNRLSVLWQVLRDNSSIESLEILNEFFLGYTTSEDGRTESIQTFLEHLEAGLILNENSDNAASWDSFLTQYTASIEELFISAALYQALFPGSGAGQGFFADYNLPNDFYNNLGTAASRRVLVVRNNRVSTNFLFTCDPALVPRSLSEVEYIVEVTNGTRNVFGYDTGTRGVREYAQVRLLRYPGGRVVRSYGEVVGNMPPDSFTYTGSAPTTRSGGSPNEDEVRALITQAVNYVLNLR